MSWGIKWDGSSVEYTFQGETFAIDSIAYDKGEIRNERGGGYKEPDDTIVEDVYFAKSEHGTFRWKVSARASGFDAHADIEEVVLVQVPTGCECDLPVFEIYESDD